MLNHFNARKAVEAAAVLLRYEDGKMEHLRLLKLFYVADRESIKETGEPISLSRIVAMDYGPLSSEVYDLIKGEREDEAIWSKHIRTHGNSVRLISDPGRGELSKYEIGKLNEVSQRYEAVSTWDLVETTHQFDEWIANRPAPGSCRPIPIGDIIDAVGMSQHKESIIRDLQTKAASERFFEEARG
jgi:uncharacterized phage-associated protein